MTGLVAYVNGGFHPADEASISVLDRGFRGGEGVFETLRGYDGHVFRLAAHLDRAFDGAEVLGFDPGSRGAITEAVRETARVNAPMLPAEDGVVRLTLTPGRVSASSPFPGTPTGPPTVVVTAHPLEIDPAIYEDGVRVTVVRLAREVPHVKALSYLAASLARAQAREVGAAEALLTADDGRVLEGAASNVFAVTARRLVTPPVQEGLLPGVTRATVLELALQLDLEVDERPFSLEELADVDELFLTATTREVVPVVVVDDAVIGSGQPGPVTRELHAAYRDEVERERSGRS